MPTSVHDALVVEPIGPGGPLPAHFMVASAAYGMMTPSSYVTRSATSSQCKSSCKTSLHPICVWLFSAVQVD